MRAQAFKKYRLAIVIPLTIDPIMPHHTLIGSAYVEVVQMRGAVVAFARRAVDRAVLVTRKSLDRGGREHVGIDYRVAEVGHEADGRGDDRIVPAELLQPI